MPFCEYVIDQGPASRTIARPVARMPRRTASPEVKPPSSSSVEKTAPTLAPLPASAASAVAAATALPLQSDAPRAATLPSSTRGSNCSGPAGTTSRCALSRSFGARSPLTTEA